MAIFVKSKVNNIREMLEVKSNVKLKKTGYRNKNAGLMQFLFYTYIILTRSNLFYLHDFYI